MTRVPIHGVTMPVSTFSTTGLSRFDDWISISSMWNHLNWLFRNPIVQLCWKCNFKRPPSNRDLKPHRNWGFFYLCLTGVIRPNFECELVALPIKMHCFNLSTFRYYKLILNLSEIILIFCNSFSFELWISWNCEHWSYHSLLSIISLVTKFRMLWVTKALEFIFHKSE